MLSKHYGLGNPIPEDDVIDKDQVKSIVSVWSKNTLHDYREIKLYSTLKKDLLLTTELN